MGDRGTYGIIQGEEWVGVYNHWSMYWDDPDPEKEDPPVGGLLRLVDEAADIAENEGWDEFARRIREEVKWLTDDDALVDRIWHSDAAKDIEMTAKAPFGPEALGAIFPDSKTVFADIDDLRPERVVDGDVSWRSLLEPSVDGKAVWAAERSPFRKLSTDWNFVLAADLDSGNLVIIEPNNYSDGAFYPNGKVVGTARLDDPGGLRQLARSARPCLLGDEDAFDTGVERATMSDVARPAGLPAIDVVRAAVKIGTEEYNAKIELKRAERAAEEATEKLEQAAAKVAESNEAVAAAKERAEIY